MESISKSISKYWKEYKKPLAAVLYPLSHAGSLIPFLVGLWDFWQNNLGVNPIAEMTHRTGRSAITLLMISLAVTPLRNFLNWPQINKVRRPVGLWAFFYATVHFSIFLVLDHGFNLNAVMDAIVSKNFILLGFTAGIILLILAITSLKPLLKKLGKRWKKLHRYVYAAGALAGVHFILAVKPGVIRPWYYVFIMTLLLVYRIPAVQSRLKTKA